MSMDNIDKTWRSNLYHNYIKTCATRQTDVLDNIEFTGQIDKNIDENLTR